MKKVVLIFVALLFSVTANAQDLNFGVKAGLNLSSITGDETDDLSSLTSFHAGVMADISISETFSVQPEIIYSAQGTKYDDSDGFDGKFKFDYLNIPIMAKVEVTEGLSVEAGPQIGFLLSAKDEYESASESGEDDVEEFFKSTDIAVGLGVSYAMETGLYVGARYNLGVTDIWDIDSGITNQNGVFQLSVGYFIK